MGVEIVEGIYKIQQLVQQFISMFLNGSHICGGCVCWHAVMMKQHILMQLCLAFFF